MLPTDIPYRRNAILEIETVAGFPRLDVVGRILTDGQSGGYFQDFEDAYEALGEEVPVFSIMFGDADEYQLEELAEYTNARVFDGRENLTEAFRSVKGYN